MKNLLAGLAVLLAALSGGRAAAKDSCVTCHSALEADNLLQPVKDFQVDVHRQAGLSCADCHGGNPGEDSLEAMSPAKGFRGAPKKPQIPEFCGRCHADAAYMRRYNPKLRTDQVSEYRTSTHGKRLRQGDMKVAACVDCHGAHKILSVTDPRAPVYPTNVATTCARCHSDAHRMQGYKITTNQAAEYEKSVHAQALAQGDTSAPTCSTCHGNHGATPPGVTSVANVCGACHLFFAQLFQKSPHGAVFAQMGFPGCVQCHSNHEIVKPSDDWAGIGPGSVCLKCHMKDDAGYASAKAIADDLAKLTATQARAEELIGTAERSGMEVSGARLQMSEANQALIKARVNVHTFDAREVQKLTQLGADISSKAQETARAALRERDARRKGLGLSLIFIALSIAGLYLKIRQIESRPAS